MAGPAFGSPAWRAKYHKPKSASRVAAALAQSGRKPGVRKTAGAAEEKDKTKAGK